MPSDGGGDQHPNSLLLVVAGNKVEPTEAVNPRLLGKSYSTAAGGFSLPISEDDFFFVQERFPLRGTAKLLFLVLEPLAFMVLLV